MMEEKKAVIPEDFVPSKPEEVLDTRTPEEIEAALIKLEHDEQDKKIEAKAPIEVATIAFQNYYPIFKKLVEHMPNKDARVLADYLVGWPLEVDSDQVVFNESDSKKAFAIGLELLNCKFIMMNAVQLAKMGEAMDAEEKAKMDNASPIITKEDVQTSFEYEKENETSSVAAEGTK